MDYVLHISIGVLIAVVFLVLLYLRRCHKARTDTKDMIAPDLLPTAQVRLKLFETIAEKAAEAIIVTDANQIITYVNAAFTQLHGYTLAEVQGQTPAFLQGDSADKVLQAQIKASLQNHQQWQGTMTNRTRNDQEICLASSITAIADEHGHIIGYIAVSRDLTHERTLETRLRHAHKMEAIGTLAGGISHDFNNILSAIIGYTELAMLDEKGNNPVGSHLDQIMKAAKRAADLISQILAFSRSDTQPRQILSLKPILAESLKLLRGTLPSSIEIVSTFAPDTPPILADATQMHQIMMNICTNAAYAMKAHGGTLEISLSSYVPEPDRPAWQEKLHEGKPYVMLTVSDTGHGMTPEVRKRIFEPYFTTKLGGNGTGLGLATVQGIVEHHEGMIFVESTPGKGSSFYMIFPACNKAVPPLGSESSPHTFPLPTGNKERILVVDDEESLTTMISTVLLYLGYKVDTFTSSTKALAAFEANPQAYDCIVSDQTMPNLSGAEFARQALAVRPGMPFILCSGYTEAITTAEAKELGIGEFVMKPVTGRTLAALIYNLLHP